MEEQGNVIIIRKATNVLEEFRKIKLYIENENLVKADASVAKHIYGAETLVYSFLYHFMSFYAFQSY